MKPKDQIIVALDVPDADQAWAIARELAPHVGWFKIGLELITSGSAHRLTRDILMAGGKVFYDGKFCDIPNTVKAASKGAVRSGAGMFNVHALSGLEAMRAAAEGAREAHELVSSMEDPPIVLGVTLLTSLGSEQLVQLKVFTRKLNGELRFGVQLRMEAGSFKTPTLTDADIEEMVVTLALAAKESGLHGVVASPKETAAIRTACGPDFLIVTPGVRPAGVAINDQKRVLTPREAIEAGANYLVIGRPILMPESGTRVEAAQRIAEEITLAWQGVRA